jgi:hypothetical protein
LIYDFTVENSLIEGDTDSTIDPQQPLEEKSTATALIRVVLTLRYLEEQ